MLSWLKRRAKFTINNRYINLFRSNINTNMFVSETQALINDHLKLTVFNTEGRDYQLEISSVITVERVKMMAVGHFFDHLEAVGGSHGEDRSGVKDSKHNGTRTYRLVVLRGARPLSDDNSLHSEKLVDNDVLLLVEHREPPPSPSKESSSPEDVASPTIMQINTATSQIPKRNDNRDPDPANPSVDFQTEFRRILVTMIEASVRLISADPESKEVFNQILDKLEKRHRPRVDRVALRQLTEMGFVEAKATKALQVKRNFSEAVEWLLEEGNIEENELKPGDEAGNLITDSVVDSKKSILEDQQEDPAKKILKRFLQYRRKWFQPNQQALKRLNQYGYPEDRVIDALRVTGNNENAARELLIDDQVIVPDDQGLERDSPIIFAILASPVIQLALPKPKTLLALMMLFESPNNANMWLSDPDTHPVVSQVLRIYHAEKHSLNHNRPVPAASLGGSTETSVSNTLTSSEYRPFVRTNLPSRTNSSSTTLFSRSDSQSQSFSSIPFHLRESNNGSLPWLSSPATLLRGTSPSFSPIPSSRVDTLPNTSPIPAQQGSVSTEEPMSHSGSPIRATIGIRTGTIMANGGPQQITVTYGHTATLLPNGPGTNTDIEMVDEAGQDSQDMDIQ